MYIDLTNVEKALHYKGDPILAKYELDEYIKELQYYQKQLNDIALQEAENYESNFEHKGLKVEKRKGRAIFDYKECNSWSDQKDKLKDIEKDLRSAYELYKRGKLVADENGEQLELPSVKYSKDVLILKPISN